MLQTHDTVTIMDKVSRFSFNEPQYEVVDTLESVMMKLQGIAMKIN